MRSFEQKLNTTYMYDNQWTEKLAAAYKSDYISDKDPYYVTVKMGIVLPAHPSADRIWGRGGTQ